MEYVNCNLCNSDNHKLFKETINGYRLVKCKQCGLIYLNPRPTQQEIDKCYIEDYYRRGIIQEELRETGIEKEIDKRSGIAKEILKIFGKKKGKLLDIGCGAGFFIACMRRYGWDVIGIDVSDWASKFARDKLGLNVIIGNIDDIELNEQFDVVTAYHLLEHLSYPFTSLRKISKMLAPAGILVIKGPNFSSFDRVWHGINWYSYHLPFHFYHFTSDTYRKLLEKASFSVQKIKYEYWDPVLHIMEARLRDGIRADHSKSVIGQLELKSNPIYKSIHKVLFIVSRVLNLKGRDLTIYAKKIMK